MKDKLKENELTEAHQAFLDFSYGKTDTPAVGQGSRCESISGTQNLSSSDQRENQVKAF